MPPEDMNLEDAPLYFCRRCFLVVQGVVGMKLYKYTTAQYALEYLRTNEIKVTTLFDTNDPNEWIPFLQSQEDGSNYLSQYSHKADFKKRYGEKYGFISFSSQMTNNVLWSHYADKFKGIAIEFEVVDDTKVFPVRYQSMRYRITDNELSKRADRNQLEQFIAQKDLIWAYESEWRVLVDLDSCRIGNIPPQGNIYLSRIDSALRFSGIVLGPECSVKFTHLLTELEKHKDSDIIIRRLDWDSISYSLYVMDECAIKQPILYKTKTMIKEIVVEEAVPLLK